MSVFRLGYAGICSSADETTFGKQRYKLQLCIDCAGGLEGNLYLRWDKGCGEFEDET